MNFGNVAWKLVMRINFGRCTFYSCCRVSNGFGAFGDVCASVAAGITKAYTACGTFNVCCV